MRTRVILNWALLFAVPFLFLWNVNADPIRFAKIGGVVILGALALGVYIWQRVSPSLAVAVSYILINMSLTGFGAAQQLVSICVVSSVFVAMIYRNAPKDLLRHGLKALAFMAAIQAAWCVVQHFGMDPLFTYVEEHNKNIPVGFFGQQTLLGPILAVGLISAITLGGGYLWLALVIAPITILAGSSFTFLSIAAGLGYLAIKKLNLQHVLSALILAVVLAIGLYFYDNELFNDNGRFRLWSQTIYIMTNKFNYWQQLFGLGGGSFKPVYTGFVTQAYELHKTGEIGWFSRTLIELHQMCGEFHQAHNDYLQVLFEFGFIGATALAWMLADIFLALRKTRCDVVVGYGAILLAIMANSLGNFAMRLQPHGVIALICFIVVVTQERRLVE